jgi:hypothetical protein
MLVRGLALGEGDAGKRAAFPLEIPLFLLVKAAGKAE